jgi:exodeoxyribonuclease-3
MKIASWNLNSIRVRFEKLQNWLVRENPDLVLLQELKCEEAQMPDIDFASYNLVGSYQKTYNGVAILSKYPIDEVKYDFEGNPDSAQARYIEIVCNTPCGYARFISIYFPNGGEVYSDKFDYKLKFYEAFTEYVKKLRRNNELLFVGGDYNVAPGEIDVYDAHGLAKSTCFTMEERSAFHKMVNEAKLLDAYRIAHPDKVEFTWWDYRGNGFSHNKGMRIDHILLNPKAADILLECHIDHEERGKEQASDHAPIVILLELCAASKLALTY